MPTRSRTTEGGYTDPLSTLHNSVDSRKNSPPWTLPIIFSSYIPIVSLIFSPLHQGLSFSWALPPKSYRERANKQIYFCLVLLQDGCWLEWPSHQQPFSYPHSLPLFWTTAASIWVRKLEPQLISSFDLWFQFLGFVFTFHFSNTKLNKIIAQRCPAFTINIPELHASKLNFLICHFAQPHASWCFFLTLHASASLGSSNEL